MGLLRRLGKIVKNVGLPALGFAIGGPAGAALGGALAGGIGEGKPKLRKIGMGALSGAVSGGSTAGLLGGIGSQVAKQGVRQAALGGLKQLGTSALRNPDLALGALSAYQQHQAGQRADKAAQGALDFERQQFNEAAPLRQLGMQGMLASPPKFQPLRVPRREDVGFGGGWSNNPFRR